jgi:hypothetical protein
MKNNKDGKQEHQLATVLEPGADDEGTIALVVDSSRPDAPGNVALAICSSCGGLALFCGGAEVCPGPAPSDHDSRWLTAIRTLFAGLLLADTEAALWGGALVRFALRFGSGSPPQGIAEMAGARADPLCGVTGVEAARMALALLVERDVDAALDLQSVLGTAKAAWLGTIWHLAGRSARAAPQDRARFSLVAVPCDDCAKNSPTSVLAGFVPVGTYDAAIRCPTCGAVSRHPLPWVTVGEPHPVGRCVRGSKTHTFCLVHKQELDAEGLCNEGREILGQAVAHERAPGPKDADFLDALARARRLWIDGGGLARAVVTSDTLGPVFAALAAANPETAKVLAQMAGAPLDLTMADPAILAQVSRHPSLDGVIADGVEVLTRALPSLRGLLGEHAPKGTRLCPPTADRRKDHDG